MKITKFILGLVITYSCDTVCSQTSKIKPAHTINSKMAILMNRGIVFIFICPAFSFFMSQVVGGLLYNNGFTRIKVLETAQRPG
jgi:hypothetical protein